MTRLSFSKFAPIFVIVFVCSAIPLFAQHGGGGGGGGFHGGGGGGRGFHSGGGGSHGGGGGGGSHASGVRSGGGAIRSAPSSPPPAGASYSRPMASAPSRSGGESFAKPSGNEFRSSASAGNASPRGGNSVSAPRAVADGQWHSFARESGGQGNSAAPPRTSGLGSAGSDWQVSSGNRTSGQNHATRTFSGQGNQVWENATGAQNVVSKSHALSNIRSSFGTSNVSNAAVHSTAPLTAPSRVSRGVAPGNNLRVGAQFGNSVSGDGNGLLTHRGCWNCGFRGGRGYGWGNGAGWGNGIGWGYGGGWGYGLGWGFGYPGFGFGIWSPFYWDNLGWGWPGYGSFGHPAGYPYGYIYNSGYNGDYNNNSNSNQDNSSYSAPDSSNTDNDSNYGTTAPSEPITPQASIVVDNTVPVLLFMKDGSVYLTKDYWFSDDQLNYVLMNGREVSVDSEQLDMRRTNEENAKSGVKFIVRSEPGGSTPSQDDGTQ